MPAPDPNLDDLVTLAVELAHRAAEVHRRGLDGDQTYEPKTSATDLVSEVDREAERLIVDGIRQARPHDAVLGEEETDRQGSSGVRGVIDPLDGRVIAEAGGARVLTREVNGAIMVAAAGPELFEPLLSLLAEAGIPSGTP